MKKNLDLHGKLIRLTLALLLLGYAIWQKSLIAGLSGLFVLYEALAGWCLFYQLTGKNSCPIPTEEPPEQTQDKFTKLLFCLCLCFSVELTSAWLTQQSVSTWYPTLNKPWWTPPNLAFPIAWTAIYVMMAVSLWIITIKPVLEKTAAYASFSIQLLLNFAWSLFFFYMRSPLLGLVDIILLIAATCATIAYFWKHSALAGILLFPYILWLGFAATINLYILLLN